MARPKHLPNFNPEIPQIIKNNPIMLLYVERAIEATQENDGLAGLRWLKAKQKFITQMLRLSGNQIPRLMTADEVYAMKWLHHKGCWDASAQRKFKKGAISI